MYWLQFHWKERDRKRMRGLTDIHNHILPMVDDGASSVVEALKMIKRQEKDGVKNIILTPHYRKGMFEVSSEEVEWKFYKFREFVERKGFGVNLYLGRECYGDTELVKSLLANPTFQMNGTKYVLVEFSHYYEFQKIRNSVYELVSEGYNPILAHIERYACLTKNDEYIEELTDMGAYMQVNAGTLLGKMGIIQKCMCKRWLQERRIHFIASDAHDLQKRKPNLLECKKYVEKKVGDHANEIFVENPQLILEGNRR